MDENEMSRNLFFPPLAAPKILKDFQVKLWGEQKERK
jgi:hypothetical protein